MEGAKAGVRMDLQNMNILLVEDDQANIILLKGMLKRAGYNKLTVVQDARQAPTVFSTLEPDLLLLDLHMPHMSGFDVMAALEPYIPRESYFPILMLTADERPEVKQEALRRGAKDFLTKPFDSAEVTLRIKNLLEARRFYLQLKEHNARLEEKVKARTKQLEDASLETLMRLARAAEFRDDDVGDHVWRVARTASLIAAELGLPRERVEMLLRAARLHDIGKIGIPEGILLKPGALTPQEFEVVKTHTTIGAQLLTGGRSAMMKMAEQIALTHHERWDGQGYPKGLAGEAIPMEGRIMAVADAFDTLTHDRVYQAARSPSEAIAEIRAQSGKQFDPAVVEACLRLYGRGELAPASRYVSG